MELPLPPGSCFLESRRRAMPPQSLPHTLCEYVGSGIVAKPDHAQRVVAG